MEFGCRQYFVSSLHKAFSLFRRNSHSLRDTEVVRRINYPSLCTDLRWSWQQSPRKSWWQLSDARARLSTDEFFQNQNLDPCTDRFPKLTEKPRNGSAGVNWHFLAALRGLQFSGRGLEYRQVLLRSQGACRCDVSAAVPMMVAFCTGVRTYLRVRVRDGHWRWCGVLIWWLWPSNLAWLSEHLQGGGAVCRVRGPVAKLCINRFCWLPLHSY